MSHPEQLEEMVKETAEHFEWFVTLTNAQKTATREIVRSALTKAFQLGVAASEEAILSSFGWRRRGHSGLKYDVLQALANLKEPKL